MGKKSCSVSKTIETNNGPDIKYIEQNQYFQIYVDRNTKTYVINIITAEAIDIEIPLEKLRKLKEKSFKISIPPVQIVEQKNKVGFC